MAVDAGMRKLKVPPKFMPYMEKHRIYELFHDLGNELAILQPEDPLPFIKQCLQRFNRCRDRRLILLIAPPYLDRIKLAHLLSTKTGCGILSRYIMSMIPGNYLDPDALAENTSIFIEESEKEGWILADYPDTVEEATRLIENRVLPTHAFLLLHEDGDTETNENDCENIRTIGTTPSLLLEFGNNIYRLRELFHSSLKIIKLKNRSLEEIANACARLTMKMPPRHAPKLFRVALLGPRGSRRRTLANILHKRFNMVHVDVEQLVAAARHFENHLGDQLRFYDKHGYSYPLKVVFDLLKNRLNQNDCLERGYVLTNFPSTLEEFVLLDSVQTPPNRVIFLDVDGADCQARLEDRVVNMYTGSLHSKRAALGNAILRSQTLTHPDDESCKIKEEIKFYNKHVQAMKDYCGNTCSVIDARGAVSSLLERVEAVLMGPSPAAKPRTGKPPPPRHSVDKRTSDSNEKTILPFPVSRTEVIPLLDSAELFRRYKELKKGPQNRYHVAISEEPMVEEMEPEDETHSKVVNESSSVNSDTDLVIRSGVSEPGDVQGLTKEAGI